MQDYNLPERRREVRGMASWWTRHAIWLSRFSLPEQILIIFGEFLAMVALAMMGLGLGVAIGVMFD